MQIRQQAIIVLPLSLCQSYLCPSSIPLPLFFFNFDENAVFRLLVCLATCGKNSLGPACCAVIGSQLSQAAFSCWPCWAQGEGSLCLKNCIFQTVCPTVLKRVTIIELL